MQEQVSQQHYLIYRTPGLLQAVFLVWAVHCMPCCKAKPFLYAFSPVLAMQTACVSQPWNQKK